MFWAAEISAATSSNGSVRHNRRSTNSTVRNASSSPMAANRRAIAADSSRAAPPISSISEAACPSSNICSIIWRATDTPTCYPQPCLSARRPTIRLVMRTRTKVYVAIGIASGACAHLLGVGVSWSIVIGLVAPIALAATPRFLLATAKGAFTPGPREAAAESAMTGMEFEDTSRGSRGRAAFR
jgi:hypothetical protein